MLEKTKKICKKYNIQPTRAKGQNFLINEQVYDSIVKIAELSKKDTVLEVGPGLGFLTEKLCEKAGQVIAIELDEKLFFAFKNRLSNDNLQVFNDDVLDMRLRDWGIGESGDWAVVANLPYNITSIFLRKIFELKNPPQKMTLMLQKEVAERIVAAPGKMSLLAVSVQFFSEAKIVEYVKKEDFWPQPEVESAVVQLIINNEQLIINNKDYFRLVKIGFAQKRKMLKNNLANGFHVSQKEAEKWLVSAGFDPKVRAQELSIEDWGRLLNSSVCNIFEKSRKKFSDDFLNKKQN